jgi:hypothetical protein
VIQPVLRAGPCQLRPESGLEAGPERVQTVLRSVIALLFEIQNWEMRFMRY